MRHKTSIYVRWNDHDMFGHVNNANYLTYMQETRADFTWYSRIRRGVEPVFKDMVVASSTVDYLIPIYEAGFNLDVEIWVAKIGNTSFDLMYELSSKDGLHARGRTTQVTVDMETKKSRRLKDNERAILAEYLEETL
jgi:acyl-CoA thioester hydrolase